MQRVGDSSCAPLREAQGHLWERLFVFPACPVCVPCMSYVLQLRGIWDLFFLILGAFPWGQGPASTASANTVK